MIDIEIYSQINVTKLVWEYEIIVTNKDTKGYLDKSFGQVYQIWLGTNNSWPLFLMCWVNKLSNCQTDRPPHSL